MNRIYPKDIKITIKVSDVDPASVRAALSEGVGMALQEFVAQETRLLLNGEGDRVPVGILPVGRHMGRIG